MWALIAFIGLGILVAALIEINERCKARKKAPEVCLEEQACSECSLLDVCAKEEKKAPRKK